MIVGLVGWGVVLGNGGLLMCVCRGWMRPQAQRYE